jgi:D-threonate/D-erythronate kinase
MADLAIVADDLTGAADTGSCFAEAGYVTVIPLRSEIGVAADVVVCSSESRDLDATAASAVTARTVRALLTQPPDGAPRWLYKKIDSALRGHPRAELQAVMAAARADRALVAPAFPAEGRTTVGGRQFVDGLPVEASRLGAPGAASDLLALFSAEGMMTALIDLASVRAGPSAVREIIGALPPGIAVADAETDDDLAILAGAVGERQGLVLCGAAGFARQLAPLLPLARFAPQLAPEGAGDGPVLVVAGSRHQTTARQIERLAGAGVLVVRLDQETIESADATVDTAAVEAAEYLADGQSVVVTTAGLHRSALGERTVASILAAVATDPRVRGSCGGMVLTGGDVAAAVCAELGVEAIRLRGDVAPGIPWGTLIGGARPGLPIVTKAGSFGDDDALLLAVRFLANSSTVIGTMARLSQF